MKKLLARIKQWNKENAGLTLVEIIVTMLILVIIALPILGGFIVSARANAMAKDMAYARDAAENVVEVMNGVGVSAETFGSVGWGCVPSPSPTPMPGPTVTPMPGATATPIPKDVYTVTGIKAGTGTYTAVIECEKNTYLDANSYELPDMSLLDSEETVVIFPESNFYKFKDDGSLDDTSELHQFDATAIDDFYYDYYYGVIDIYQNVIYSAYLDEVKKIEEYNEEHPLETPTPTPEPPKYVEDFRDKEKDETKIDQLTPIEDFIKRTMKIAIKYDTNSEFSDNVGATVSTIYEYAMTDELGGIDIEQMIRTSFTEYESVIATYADAANIEDKLDLAIYDLVVNTLKVPKTYKVAADTTLDTLDNIYLITYPFHAVGGQVEKYNTLSLSLVVNEEKVPNNHLANKNINVFVAVQQDDNAYNPTNHSDSIKLTVDAGSYTKVLRFYSQMSLACSDSLVHPISDDLFSSKENTDGNMLLDVTVKIYSEDNPTEELAEIKTTIITK